MNSKSSIVVAASKLQSEFPNDVFEISLIEWNDTPIDTIYKKDIYALKLQELESEISNYGYLDALAIERRKEDSLRREAALKLGYSIEEHKETSNIDQNCELLKSKYNDIKSYPDGNEPYFYVYSFKEQVKRTFAVSGGADTKEFQCYGYLSVSDKVVYRVEEFANNNYERCYEIMFNSIRL